MKSIGEPSGLGDDIHIVIEGKVEGVQFGFYSRGCNEGIVNGEILVVLKEVILEGFDPRVDLNL